MCDRIAVLRNGKLVKTRDAADTDADEITSLMIGQALKALARPEPVTSEPGQVPVLSVTDIHGGGAHGVSLDVNPGEIVGLYGLVGSGRSSVARTITGQRPAVSGTIKLHEGHRLPDRGPPAGGLRQGLRQRPEHEPGRPPEDGPGRRDRRRR